MLNLSQIPVHKFITHALQAFQRLFIFIQSTYELGFDIVDDSLEKKDRSDMQNTTTTLVITGKG